MNPGDVVQVDCPDMPSLEGERGTVTIALEGMVQVRLDTQYGEHGEYWFRPGELAEPGKVQPEPVPTFEPGDRVRDTATGQIGTVQGRAGLGRTLYHVHWQYTGKGIMNAARMEKVQP